MTTELLEEIKGILTEGEFQSRWVLIETYHSIGKLLLEQKEDITKLVHDTAVGLQRSERQLWYAVKFAQKYKNINELPEGKNISFTKIVNKYLTNPKEEEGTHEHIPIQLCSICKIKL